MKMPGLSRGLHSNHSSSSSLSGYVGSGSDGRSAVWTRSNTEDVNLGQLHKFWNELSSAERRDLLRIDKHTLFEQVRKNLYCSRCHGLLVEGFAQIMNGKNRHSGLLAYSSGSAGGGSRHTSENGSSGGLSTMDDTRDPSVHSWGGLAATRDNMLTVLDCFVEGTPLEVLQNVFESARTRERERELLYPDACGGGGRGWISQSVGNFGGSGRGHGLKETCALHTARLSCEALVDFWAALGEETRRSLLRMKEEDFIERLMFRFDSKRFCRDCRRNVLREFKEMKELKRTRKEPRCTRWFCAADTVFRYEVSDSMVHVDWRDCFAGDVGTVYQRFEWAVGTAEGKSDVLGFEDVGLSETVQIDGLDLGSVSACHITIRGLRRDGRTSELAAKAHALKGQLCVHRRLIVGDGIVSITKGESIQRFFERAEETEEEEDEDSMDKDGNDLDGEGTRPQKHAKSPELARDFLLDAATVIFKEQVEKAFREGTARQNAHSIFVCLALSLLEERVRVACKEITTLEKQNKLLEEEEDEKREEEERRERRKLREKEKKLRKKEKLKGRAKDRSKGEVKSIVVATNGHMDTMSCASEEEQDCSSVTHVDGESRTSDSVSARPSSPDMVEARPSGDGSDSDCASGKSNECISGMDDVADTLSKRDGNGAFIFEQSKSAKRRSQMRKNQVSEASPNSAARKGPSRTPGDEDKNCGPARDPVSGSLQRYGSTGNRKVGADNNHNTASVYSLKRFDSWSSTVPESHKRHEHHQQCACGSPQNGVRAKIHGQRSFARIVCKDAGSAKGERDGYSASKPHPVCGNETEVPAEAQGSLLPPFEATTHGQGHRDTTEILAEWKDSLAGESSIGAEASREQRQDAEVDEMPGSLRQDRGNDLCAEGCARNYADSGSPSDGVAGSSSGQTVAMDSPNGHTTVQVGPSSASTGKLVWVSNTANSSSSSLAGVSVVKSPAISASRASVNGSLISKVAASRTGQGKARRPNGMTVVPRAAVVGSGALLPSSTASGPVSISTASASLATSAPASEEASETAVISASGEASNGGQSINEAPPVVVSDGNIMTSTLQRSVSSSSLQQYSVRTAGSGRTGPHTSTLSTASDPFEPERIRQQNYIKTASGPRNGLSLESKVLLEANCSRPPVHAVVATGMMQAMEGPGPGQHLHADKNVLIHNGAVIPPGMVVGPHHLHSGPQSGLPTPGNGVRPMKNMFPSSAEMLPMAACGPVPMHLHPSQQSYGYFHMQPPWAPRGRNGVLPLPQPGGFVLSGPGGMGMPIGSLPPMSLPVPASLQPLPPPSLAGPGHFQVPMQNGLNSLARETAFLSRYGGRSNGTPPGVTRSGGHQVLALSQPEAGVSVPQEEAKHASDGGSPTSVAPVDGEGPAQGANDDSPLLNKPGGNFPPFLFGGSASSPAAQVFEPDSSSKDTGSSKETEHVAPNASNGDLNVPEISRTRRCVDEHAAGTGPDLCSPSVGEYSSLFAAAPGKGLGFF